MYNKIDINAEHNELILKNSHGDHTIVPANKRDWVKNRILLGKHSDIDEYVNTLPQFKDYAEDGTVIPKFNNNSIITENNPTDLTDPPARFESEFYRLYASGKGAHQEKTPDQIQKGWIFKNGDNESFVAGTQDEEPTSRFAKGKPTYTDSYIIKGQDGYSVKANSKGRLYPDISKDYPEVETEGDKHWNIAKYAYAPFFGMTETDGYHYNSGTPNKDGYYPKSETTNPLILPESDIERRKMLEDDISIYYNSFDELSPDVKVQKTKEFMTNNIDPLINSQYHKYNRLGVKGLGRVDEDRGKDADWFTSIDEYNNANPKSQITDAYDGLIDYNIKFRKLDEKEAKLRADNAQSKYLSEKNKSN